MPRSGKKIQKKLEARVRACHDLRKNAKGISNPEKAFKMPGSRKWKQ